MKKKKKEERKFSSVKELWTILDKDHVSKKTLLIRNVLDPAKVFLILMEEEENEKKKEEENWICAELI